MFQKNTIYFRGSRERLRRMVIQGNGEFLEDRRFRLLWRSSQYKEFHRLTFRINCRYEKKQDGYEIGYTVFPTAVSFLRITIPWVVWSYAILEFWGIKDWKEGSFLIAFGIFYTAAQLWQMADCRKEFVSKFTKETH